MLDPFLCSVLGDFLCPFTALPLTGGKQFYSFPFAFTHTRFDGGHRFLRGISFHAGPLSRGNAERTTAPEA